MQFIFCAEIFLPRELLPRGDGRIGLQRSSVYMGGFVADGWKIGSLTFLLLYWKLKFFGNLLSGRMNFVECFENFVN